MPLYSAESIVLRTRNFEEADRVVSLYTKEYGKVEAVARGARRPRNRLVGAMQPFTHARVFLFHGRGLDSISQCEIREPFAVIREDLVLVAYGSYIAELVDRVVEEREQNEELFTLLLDTLGVLASGCSPELCTRFFELRLMSVAGYRPQVGTCLVCAGAPDGTDAVFSAMSGGLLCGRCAGRDENAVPVSEETVRLMRRLLRMHAHSLGQVEASPQALYELERAMRFHIRYHVERRFKSLRFLELVRLGEISGHPQES